MAHAGTDEETEAVPEWLAQWAKEGREAVEDGRPWDVADLDPIAEEHGRGESDWPLPTGVFLDSNPKLQNERFLANGIGYGAKRLGSFDTRTEAAWAREQEERRLGKGPYAKYPVQEDERCLI